MNRTPNILLVGKNGQVGRDLSALLPSLGNVTAVDRSQLDLTQPSEIERCARFVKPDVIINAAAYTAVDRAESEPALAEAVNATAPSVLAAEAKACGALLVHYSTDYVFDGSKPGAYVEGDPVAPLNVYGRTKLQGEEAIQHLGCRHLIFRTSWVFSSRGSNFLLTMLRLATQRDELRIVADQLGAPTSSESIARGTTDLLRDSFLNEKELPSGVYHMTSRGETSWCGFARRIFAVAEQRLGLHIPRVEAIPTAEYPTPARRPFNSRLNCDKLRVTFGVRLPHWEESLDAVMAAIPASLRQKAAAG